ncbi:MAG: TraR/DksA family transcriptional regulator [Kineosporiaceae bacterium]|nr:TraR/DksA family transcriptional regulator [Kineosporiaceae bacterium]
MTKASTKAPAKTNAKPPTKAASSRAEAAVAAELAVRANEAPWTPEELAEVRVELGAEVARLTEELRAIEEGIADVLRDSGDGAGDDQADSGAKAFEREQGMTLLSTTRQALDQTERALERIADGTYGVCESCGLAVGKLRMQAFPRALLCLSCKQEQEQERR